MGKPLSIDLRSRALAAVDEGVSCRAAATRFGVVAAPVIRWHDQRRSTGVYAAKPQGGDTRSRRIEAHRETVLALHEARRDITLDELRRELGQAGVKVAISTLLHYGRDDFASDLKLATVLSRDRAKDMAADYAAEPDEAVRSFADRREIRLPERVREIARTVETKARGMFAGFKPKAQEAVLFERVPESTNRPDQDVAIRRYARAAVDIAGMEEKGLSVLPHQGTALVRASEGLDKARHMGL